MIRQASALSGASQACIVQRLGFLWSADRFVMPAVVLTSIDRGHCIEPFRTRKLLHEKFRLCHHALGRNDELSVSEPMVMPARACRCMHFHFSNLYRWL